MSPAEVAPDDLRDRVSLVLLTYNCGHRLKRVLEKAAGLDLDVIVVDNGSADDTCEVVRQCSDVKLVALPENIGAAARNIGLQRAATPYVAFCDDDGWYERDGLRRAAQYLDAHPTLAVVNARIVVGASERLDPICAEMAASPLPERAGIPGAVLLGFMAGAVVVRVSAFQQVGGYAPRFFIGGEEETLAFPLVKAGWQMRYLPEVVMHHEPSVANVDNLRAFGLRNTLWNCWLHRRRANAVRWTAYTLWHRPKNRNWVRGVAMAVAGMPSVWRERRPMSAVLDEQLAVLDRAKYRTRRSFFTFRE